MNQKSMIIGAVVLLVFIGGIFYVINTQSSEGWSEDWLPDGQTNQGISGKWYIDTYLIYADGSKESLKSNSESLWVQSPSGAEVTYIEYILKAQATRDMHTGTFTAVEIDVTDLDMYTKFYPSSDQSQWMKLWFSYDQAPNPVLSFVDGSTETNIETIVTLQIPSGITNSEGFAGGGLNTLPCDTMNALTQDWGTGDWFIDYYPVGSIHFRGKNAEYGDGQWEDANLPGTVTHSVVIGGNEVNMDWSSDVVYN